MAALATVVSPATAHASDVLWGRPFAPTSIWNRPLPPDATLLDVGPKPVVNGVFPDPVHLVRTSQDDPVVDVIQAGGWLNRCSGTKPTGLKTRLPVSLLIADVTTRAQQPNSHLVVLQPDGHTIVQVAAAARCAPGGPLYGYVYGPANATSDIRGDGQAGTHASQLSALGGIIRAGELTSAAPIRHALDIELDERANYWWGGSQSTCFQWPATSCDDYAGKSYGYHGTDARLRIGALLAIPATVGAADLGITTDIGRKLYDALRNYGAYATESAAWPAYNLAVESGADTFPFEPTARAELQRLIAALRVVADNGPSVGSRATAAVAVANADASNEPVVTTDTPVVTQAPALAPAPEIIAAAPSRGSVRTRSVARPSSISATAPTPVVPESPVPLALPVTAVGLMSIWVWRRARSRHHRSQVS